MPSDDSALDLLDLNSLLTEEERSVQMTVRRFMEKEVAPRIVQLWRDGEQPIDLYERFAQIGLLGASLPFGGPAPMGARAYGLVMLELERVDSCIRSMVSVQNNLCMYPIWKFGNEQQHEEYLPQMIAGKRTGCFCLSEPDAGSDPASMRTTAIKVAGGYRISGTKRWITNGTNADFCIVWAKLDSAENEIRGFIVDGNADGLSRSAIKDKISFRASDTAEIILDNVFVPENNLLEKTTGLKSALAVLSKARYGIVWGTLGAAQCCLEVALDFLSHRQAFGKPLTQFQLVQKKCAEMARDLSQAKLLAYRLAELSEAALLRPEQVSLGKMNNVEMALRVARTCRELLGANGIMDEYPIMRHLCNLETVYTYEGTHDVHLLILGHAVTGESAFR
jgi:glutaryl-CoA dehydrogenase